MYNNNNNKFGPNICSQTHIHHTHGHTHNTHTRSTLTHTHTAHYHTHTHSTLLQYIKLYTHIHMGTLEHYPS